MTPLEEIGRLQDVRIALEIELDRKIMTLRELLSVETGAVLRLTRSAGENIDILVDGSAIGSGEIVIIDEAMGVRVTGFRSDD